VHAAGRGDREGDEEVVWSGGMDYIRTEVLGVVKNTKIGIVRCGACQKSTQQSTHLPSNRGLYGPH
jgi:hypothetical protein